jgi:hypothetical protein
MSTWIVRTALIGCSICAWAPAALAQQAGDTPASDEPETLPRYEVEIILFAYRDADPGEELFSLEAPRSSAPPSALLPIEQQAYGDTRLQLEALPGVPPIDPAEPAAGTPSPGLPPPPSQAETPEGALQPIERLPGTRRDGASQAQPFHFRLLRPDEMQLDEEYARISRVDAYQPLAHAGWVQDGLAEDEAHAIDVAYLGVANPSGTIRLYVSRFLHLNVDLTYRAPRSALPEDALANPAGLSELHLPQQYVLHQQRRARSGELHYIDHPMFGLLFMIRPAPEEQEETEPSADAELAPAA